MEEKIKDVEGKIKEIEGQIGELQTRKSKLIALREKLKNDFQEEKSALIAHKDWDRQDFEWSEKLENLKKSVFKIGTLRPLQLPSMNATLSDTDCIVIMPTGGGKSLCYQLPALISKGITVVVSPLISLMEDQLMGLQNFNVEAKMLSASSTKEDVNWVHSAMTDQKSTLKLLYVTPEKLAKNKRFMSKLQKMYQMGRFSRLAIDEVHCCSHWGHDFRPDYKFLGIMKNMFPGVPILGLTATATGQVIADVQKILHLEGCLILRAALNRPNLFYEVRTKPSNQNECITELVKLLQGEFKNQSGIIYTMTIKETEELATNLAKQGIKVAPYHASLDSSLRSKIHKKWVTNIYQAVVATTAFGMGIDKPDVRFVIHHCISKSLENFYQESGRAGRDDKPAKCILFWRYADMVRQSTMVFTEHTGLENLYGMISYCIDSHRCRRNIVADHFSEVYKSKDCRNMCDHCCANFITENMDVTLYANQLLRILKKASSLDSRLTGTKLVDIWLGKGSTNMRIKEATATQLSRERAESIVAHLLVDSYLREDFHFTPYSTISYLIPGHKANAELSPSPMVVAKRKSWKTDTPVNVPASVSVAMNSVQLEVSPNKREREIIQNKRSITEREEVSRKRHKIILIDSSDSD